MAHSLQSNKRSTGSHNPVPADHIGLEGASARKERASQPSKQRNRGRVFAGFCRQQLR